MKHLFVLNNQVLSEDTVKTMRECGHLTYLYSSVESYVIDYDDAELDGDSVSLYEFFYENGRTYDNEDFTESCKCPKWLQDKVDEYLPILSYKELEDDIKALPEGEYKYDRQLNDEPYFRDLLKKRLQHCGYSLKANLHKAKKQYDTVFWDGGHFSRHLYKILEEALGAPMDSWSALVWQQIVRQMFLSNERYQRGFMYATEKMLLLGKE